MISAQMGQKSTLSCSQHRYFPAKCPKRPRVSARKFQLRQSRLLVYLEYHFAQAASEGSPSILNVAITDRTILGPQLQ